ncbi:MAG: family 10 glycosylhydrolase [Clostridia bacterium]|nr:family 10 glycosylhydrolase [Clostridia bacterium]
MKKAVVIILAFVVLTCSCTAKGRSKAIKPSAISKQRIVGVWISCYELGGMLDRGNFKEEFSLVAENLHSLNIGDAFIHVRAFGDSLFKSEYYPENTKVSRYDFDVLKSMIDELTRYNIRFHAWINPFRTQDGSFSNPADITVRKNILSGVREIVKKYDVAGIHFDDYFYPSANDNIDAQSFSEYTEASDSAITLTEYRRANITSLMFEVKNAVKHINPDIIFSVSPAADIKKNAAEAFADIAYWCKNGAVDWIIPQLYFGFDYPKEEYKFDNLLSVWRRLPRKKDVEMIIGLPSYKLGTDTPPDNIEWVAGTDILARQVKKVLSNNDLSGVCFFSYSSLFCEDDLHKQSLALIKKALAA